MECPVGSSCLPSKIRSGLSLVYVKWSLFISQHPLIPLLKNSGVEQLCMHPGTPGCDGLKLYPIHLTLSSLYFIFFYRLYSNGAVFQEMQGGKNLCLPELFSFNIQCRAKTQISVCLSLIAAFLSLRSAGWTSGTGQCLLLLLTAISIPCHVIELPSPLASLAIIVLVGKKNPTPHIMGWPEAIMELNVPIRII